jgi:hypothetical protein
MRPGERLAHHVADARLPQPVGVVGAFDLDDLGAQVPEEPAELAPGDDHTQIEDPQVLERIVSGPARR